MNHLQSKTHPLRQDTDVYVADALTRLETELVRSLNKIRNGLQKF